MAEKYKIFCDESGHLEHEEQKVMVLGGIWCPASKTKEIFKRIREIKVRHGLNSKVEVKWIKVSNSKLAFYEDLVNYFFDNSDLHFRALVIPNKSLLRHKDFDSTHDEWYYKMFFNLLKVILSPENTYEIYLDIKDTRSTEKVNRLREVLCNNLFDFNRQIITNIQNVKSHDIELIQLTDLLIGAIAYKNKGLFENDAKKLIVDKLVAKSGYDLTKKTLYRESKLNIFIWEPAKDIC